MVLERCWVSVGDSRRSCASRTLCALCGVPGRAEGRRSHARAIAWNAAQVRLFAERIAPWMSNTGVKVGILLRRS